jgi:hypothetical protein
MFQAIRLKAETNLNGPNLVFHINEKQIMARSKYEIWLKVYFSLWATNPSMAEQIFSKRSDDKRSDDKQSIDEYIDTTLNMVLKKCK